jgi:SLA1 homology domain 1, SHD1
VAKSPRTVDLSYGKLSMSRIQATVLLLAALQFGADTVFARTWTDATGDYTLDAELIGFNDTKVVVQRGDHELAALPIEKLSQADRDYLKSKEAEQARSEASSRAQTWTLADGSKLVGKVVDFTRKEITIQRRRGRIYVNDRVLDNLPEFYQAMLPRIVAHFDRFNPVDRSGLESWAVRQGGQPRSFQLEGVVMEFENGDEYAIPFFFFATEDLRLLQSGWHNWLAARDDWQRRDEHAYLLQQLAAARQRDAQVNREIATMQLKLQAVEAGLTSLWEVTLYPVAGNRNPPQWVVIAGRDSRQATANALAQNPGFVAGPVRRVAPR